VIKRAIFKARIKFNQDYYNRYLLDLLCVKHLIQSAKGLPWNIFQGRVTDLAKQYHISTKYVVKDIIGLM